MNTTNNTLGSSSLSKKDRETLDFYQTPSYATESLLERFDFESKNIWEPMTGNGAIAKPLRDAGYNVFCTDLVERKFALDATFDYFKQQTYNGDNQDFSIVTNPPYGKVNEFLEHTLNIIKPKTCCLFLPVRYLEGIKRYNEIYSKFKPAKVFVYAQRLGCFKESDVEAGLVGERGVGSAVAYMWLCFRNATMLDQNSKTEIEWIP
jgi:hypothetical protein